MRTLIALFLVVSSLCFADEKLELLISSEQISQKLIEVADQIEKDYAGQELTVIVVMKGAICIGADLIRHLNLPCRLEYMKASSYGAQGAVRGELKITGVENLDLSNKNVLVVDDIFDTGNTMAGIINRLQEMHPKSLKSLVLLMKNVSHSTSYRPDYVLFDIEDRFVVGYGLDYKEYYRGLPGVYAFRDEPIPQ